MPYTFDGINDFFNEDGKPSPLYKKMYDDVWKCIHCGCKDLDWKATPAYVMMHGSTSYRPADADRQVKCKKCGERLTYLENRFYGLTPEQMRKSERFHLRKLAPWGIKHPLWAIGDNKDGKSEKTD